MPQSLAKLYIHIIFHIKSTSVPIRKQDAHELYAYIGSIINSADSIPIMINGMEDHIHILCALSKNISLAKLIEKIKSSSSKWIKGKDNYYHHFAWQGGYGGFSVSPSLHDKTTQYILKQEEHHRRLTFKEEYLLFLKEYNIQYDENYL